MTSRYTTLTNLSADKYPIVLHSVNIIRDYNGTADFHNKHLQSDFRSQFSKYGNIWSFDFDDKINAIVIGFDNSQACDSAVKNERKSCKGNRKLSVKTLWPSYGKLTNDKNIINQKLNNPTVDINTLMKCNNYWNKDMYPLDIIQETLEDKVNTVDTATLYSHGHDANIILCYHKNIKHPFAIHMACSESISTQHIIYIRPQSIAEIGRMLWKPNISLLKQVLPHNYAFGVDWRYYDFIYLWNRALITSYIHEDSDPYECIKYMINVIGCDIRDRKYEPLHVAAMRHDLNLVNFFLDLGVNPLQKSADKYKETALVKCKWRWKLYEEQQLKMNSPEFAVNDVKNESEFEGKHDDIKSDTNINECVYIHSIYLSKLICVDLHSINFVSQTEKNEESVKPYSQFLLQSENNSCVIKIKFGCLSYKRICRMKQFECSSNKSDLALTANLKDKTVNFLPYKENKNEQQWFIEKRKVGDVEGIKLCTQKYELYATQDFKLKLKQTDLEKNDEKEGRNLDETLESMFIILKNFTIHKFQAASYKNCNWLQYKSLLTGDIEKCRRIHQKIVQRLESAMKIQKLHGDTIQHHSKIDHDEKQNKEKILNDAKVTKKYKPPRIVHRFDGFRQQKQHFNSYNRFDRENQKVIRETGICKRYNVKKGFGFISADNGSGDIFVHHSEIKAKGFQSLLEGESVEFEIVVQNDGRKKATNVTGPNNSFVKGQNGSH